MPCAWNMRARTSRTHWKARFRSETQADERLRTLLRLNKTRQRSPLSPNRNIPGLLRESPRQRRHFGLCFVSDCIGSYRFRPMFVPDYTPNCWRLFVCHACTSHFPSQFFRAGKGMFVCSPLLLCMYISCSHGRCIC